MDARDPYDYHSVVAEFLRTQRRIFSALDPANSERELDLPGLTREAFDQHVDAVFSHFPVAYANRTAIS